LSHLLKCVIPKMYRGHMRQSQRVCHIIFTVIPWRLCISDLDGSSRNTLFTMMISSLCGGWRKLHIRREQGSGAHRSVNQPLGRNHALVCVGPGGINAKENRPHRQVKIPSMRNRYRHPATLLYPRSCKMPVARKAPTIWVM
jgi:hypothetical protein